MLRPRSARHARSRAHARTRLALPLKRAALLLQLVLLALQRALARCRLVVVRHCGVVLFADDGTERRRCRSTGDGAGDRRAGAYSRAHCCSSGRPRRRLGGLSRAHYGWRRTHHWHSLAQCWLQLRRQSGAPRAFSSIDGRLRGRVLGGRQVVVEPEHGGVDSRACAHGKRARVLCALCRFACQFALPHTRGQSPTRRGAGAAATGVGGGGCVGLRMSPRPPPPPRRLLPRPQLCAVVTNYRLELPASLSGYNMACARVGRA